MDILVAILAFVAVFGLGAIGGAVALFVLWPRIGTLERQLERQRERLQDAEPLRPRLEALERRLERLQAAATDGTTERTAPARSAPFERAPALDVRPATTPAASPELPPTPPTVGPARRVTEPALSPIPALDMPVEPIAVPEGVPTAAEPQDIPPSAEPGPLQPAAMSAEPGPSATTWEQEVGSNWLNKLGVLIVVIGLALGVSYSFARVGPVGRVALGFGLSLGMLAAGVAFARRERFRNYGHGLVAGGWAGTYFTAYAMHGIDAVRLIEDPLAAIILLLAVSAGMISHGLRYRSQTVTALTFIVSYATLSLTPLTIFALVAAVPLAVSVMAVGERYGWTGVSVLGVSGTYGLIALRGLGIGGPLETASVIPAVLLAIYWATFEVADVLGHRSRRPPTSAAKPITVLNAVGFLTAVGLVLPLDQPQRLSVYLAVMGAAALVSAFARRRWMGGQVVEDDESGSWTFSSYHVPVMMSALLIFWSTGVQFEGANLALRWLVEAELFFAAGVVLRDHVVRRVGSLLLVLPAFVAVAIPSQAVWLGVADTSFVLTVLAAVGYANREWMRTRRMTPADLEGGYAWAGSALLAVVLSRELAAVRLGISLMVLATVLVEAGVRRAAEYRRQAYVVGTLGALLVGMHFAAGDDPSTTDIWTVLPMAVALSWGWALRLANGPEGQTQELRRAVRGASWVGTWMLALFEWRVVADPWFTPLLAVTGAALLATGTRRRLTDLWWQGCALMSVSAMAATELLTGGAPDNLESTALLIVIGVIYASALVGPMPDEDPRTSAMRPALTALSILATGLLTALEWQRLSDTWEEPAIASTGLALMVVGTITRLAFFRWQGYALLIGAALSAMVPILEPNPAFGAPAIAALVCVGLLYATSAGGRLQLRGVAAPQELSILGVMFVMGTLMLATIEWRVLPDAWAGPIKAVTGLAFVGAGIAASERGLRAQGRALLFAAAARTAGPLFAASTPAPVVLAMLSVIGSLYASSLLTTRLMREAPNRTDSYVDAIMSVTASTLLVALVADEMRASLVTATWGLIGLGLLVFGFPARDRVLRLSGLAVLAICVLKLFVYDLSTLEALPRIMSFVVLGLVLLAVSWGYTRFGEQIRKYL
jgi:uncharacterized membrane protein